MSGTTTEARVGGWPGLAGVGRWASAGWENRRKILLYAVINVAITAVHECVARAIAVKLGHEPQDFAFWVPRPDGTHSLNRQSAINLWMTFFVSTLGGPVFFFEKRHARYLFFVGFGAGVASLSQLMVRSGFDLHRLCFDVAYMATVKFGLFELFRSPILRAHHNALQIGAFRAGQDFLTTFFRVSVLNVLGFKG